ncbi:hypothetical protein [Amycolatopsis sp. NPDC004079]|uniref:hypothetical protein n=1 Tax=Amycolatopsis sp. NPDC004079 TaxID=3154549 RepID=UPI0033A01D5A
MDLENDFARLFTNRGPPVRRIYFTGRWLLVPDVEEDSGLHINDPSPYFARHTAESPAPPDAWRAWIAQTERRKILVHIHHWAFDDGTSEVFELFDTFEQARARYGRDERICGWDAAAERLRALIAYDESHLDI